MYQFMFYLQVPCLYLDNDRKFDPTTVITVLSAALPG